MPSETTARWRAMHRTNLVALRHRTPERGPRVLHVEPAAASAAAAASQPKLDFQRWAYEADVRSVSTREGSGGRGVGAGAAVVL